MSLYFLCVLVVYASEGIVPAIWTAKLLVSGKFPTFALKWLSEFIVKTDHRGVE